MREGQKLRIHGRDAEFLRRITDAVVSVYYPDDDSKVNVKIVDCIYESLIESYDRTLLPSKEAK